MAAATPAAPNIPNHPQQFCVRWNSYQSNLQNAFPKLLTSEHFVDVTLACENEMVKCHKVVLSACSTYFEKLLVQNPCQHPIIFMKDMKFAELQALVDFMYQGEVNVTQEQLPSLLKSAEALQIRGLCGSDQLLNSHYLTQSCVQANGIASAAATNGENKKQENGLTDFKKVVETIENGRLENIKKEESVSGGSGVSGASAASGGAASNEGGSTPDRFIKEDPYDNDESYYDEDGLNMDTDYLEQDEDTDAGKTGLQGPSGANNSLDKTTPEYAMANVSCQYSENSPGLQGNAQRRIRRSEAELRSAAECITRGQTFQTVSDQFNIPISTIRFYMARKGILPRRKRGRACSMPGGSMMMGSPVGLGGSGNSTSGIGHGTPLNSSNSGGFHSAPGNTSPVGPPYHIVHYKLPALGAKLK